jgi:peptidylprolyl isomerase
MVCHDADMKYFTLIALSASAFASFPLSAEEAKPEYPSPPEIVAKADAKEWVAIAPSDLLVMELAPDAKGKPRRVVVQLMPAPFSQGWISNIRKLAAAKFWDGTSVNRVQDNYVVQWGDATEKKALPEGLAVVPEKGYVVDADQSEILQREQVKFLARSIRAEMSVDYIDRGSPWQQELPERKLDDNFVRGWPFSLETRGRGQTSSFAPVHCYSMVGVGRNLSPDTGSGAELYTVIGHAPRHLDRNIALVGRVIEGIEHLSSLPRGTGGLGFYEKEEERVPILSVRMGNDVADLPAFEYLSTESASFAAYADARANRRDPFFNVPAGGADICNIPVPVRRKAA